MDLHVFPPRGFKEDEVFRVSLKHYAQPKHKAWLTSYTRQSTYSKFQLCADKSVDARLCACAKLQSTDVTQDKVARKMFGEETIVKDLDSGCLLFLRRNYGGFKAVAVEVSNMCNNRTYRFKLDCSRCKGVYSRELPILLKLTPKSTYFLTSVNKIHVSDFTIPFQFTAWIRVKNETSVNFVNLGKRDLQ